MNLDSVRELKQSLLQTQLTPLTLHAAKAGTRAMAAKPLSGVDRVARTVALGIAHRQGRQYRLAVRIQSRSLEETPEVDRIRKAAKGEVDVRYVGRLVKRATPPLQRRRRPLVIGCSLGHYAITAGTLGCFVETTTGSELRILSNNHVLANENAAAKGDAILQPGPYDGGTRPADVIGKLERFVRLKKSAANLVDCALASVKTGISTNRKKLDGLGNLAGVSAADVNKGMTVHKVGRTTATTHGRVTAFELDNVVIGYDMGNLRFDDQIEIEGAGSQGFSDGGDSGSLIVDDDLNAVALLFAGGDVGGTNGKGLTYGNPIGNVFAALAVRLVT